jgi:hypothetical protein
MGPFSPRHGAFIGCGWRRRPPDIGSTGGQMRRRWHRTSRRIYPTVFYGKGNENHEFGTGFFVHKKIITAAKMLEFVSDRMSYITLRGRCCDIIVLNVHAPTEDKIDDTKDRFYEELEHVFDTFSEYHMQILF